MENDNFDIVFAFKQYVKHNKNDMYDDIEDYINDFMYERRIYEQDVFEMLQQVKL